MARSIGRWPVGLLAVDLDGDGLISSGRELFGTAFGDLTGFRRLERYDLDGDGWIGGHEAACLSVWVDDGDGRCQTDEVLSLHELGIEAVSYLAEDNRSLVRTSTGYVHCWDWFPELHP